MDPLGSLTDLPNRAQEPGPSWLPCDFVALAVHSVRWLFNGTQELARHEEADCGAQHFSVFDPEWRATL